MADTAAPQNPTVKHSPKGVVLIGDQVIPWSFVQKLRTQFFDGDWDRTIDCFWKARNAKGPNAIIRYISAGLRGKSKWSMLASKERDEGKMEVIRRWWNNVYTPTPKSPTTCRNVLRDVLQDLADSLGNR